MAEPDYGYIAARDLILGRVQRIRVDAQELLESLSAVEAAAKTKDADAREVAVRAAVKEGKHALHDMDLSEHVEQLEKALDSSPQAASRFGDTVWQIHNELKATGDDWPRSSDVDNPLPATASVRGTLEDLIYHAAQLTIPSRLREHLDSVRVGKPFDFNANFEDELPDPKRRRQLLGYLEAHERYFGGVVDAERGVVYKLSRNTKYRRFTYVAPLICAIAFGGLVVLIGHLSGWGLLPEKFGVNSGKELLAAYVLVLTGAVVHLIVENIKQRQLSNIPILAVGEGLDWLHLHWAGLALSFVSVVVTVLGLKLLGVGGNADDLPIFLFAGYSADSVAGLFLTRFDSAAASGLKSLKRLIDR